MKNQTKCSGFIGIAGKVIFLQVYKVLNGFQILGFFNPFSCGKIQKLDFWGFNNSRKKIKH